MCSYYIHFITKILCKIVNFFSNNPVSSSHSIQSRKHIDNFHTYFSWQLYTTQRLALS